MNTIANTLTIIRNGYQVRKRKVEIPQSGMAENLIKILVKEKYLAGYETGHRRLVVQLLYDNKKPAITKIMQVSKPGRRIYRAGKKIPLALSGIGTTIISTNAGLLTNKEAKRQNLGGEVICQVW